MPERITRSRQEKQTETAIYVGRPTRYANPFKVGEYVDELYCSVLDREDKRNYCTGIYKKRVKTNLEAVELFTKYQLPLLKKKVIEELKGKNLSCWCKQDEHCHADILLLIANKREVNSTHAFTKEQWHSFHTFSKYRHLQKYF